MMRCYGPAVLRSGDPRSEPPVTANGSDDERLVRAVAEGDRDALGTLYDRHAPAMLAVGQRVLGSAREAEDLVQDVFLEAWHRARHYDAARGSDDLIRTEPRDSTCSCETESVKPDQGCSTPPRLAVEKLMK